jgi:hypothetical protein
MLRAWGLGIEKEAQTHRNLIKGRSLNQGRERIDRPLESRRARPSQLTSNTHNVSHLRPVQRQAHPLPLEAWRQAKSLRPMCRQESQMFHPRSRSFKCVDRRSLPGLDPELTGVGPGVAPAATQEKKPKEQNKRQKRRVDSSEAEAVETLLSESLEVMRKRALTALDSKPLHKVLEATQARVWAIIQDLYSGHPEMAKAEQEVLWDFADELGNIVIETLKTVKAAGTTAGVSELAKSGFEEPVGVAADKSVGPSTQSASVNIEAGEMWDEYPEVTDEQAVEALIESQG